MKGRTFALLIVDENRNHELDQRLRAVVKRLLRSYRFRLKEIREEHNPTQPEGDVQE
jgi:hypothetical protein